MRKAKLFKTVAVLTCAAMLIGCFMLTGCGKDKTGEDGDTTLTYWCQLPSASMSSIDSFEDMTMFKELEKETGVKIKFVHPPAGQETENYNLMLASGDIPDIIEYNIDVYPGGMQKAIDDGVFIPLNDYLEEYAPNFSKLLKENPNVDKDVKTDEGLYFGFPEINLTENHVFGGLMIRKDWLDDLGLAVPETIDEWETVLTAFKEKKGAKSPLTITNLMCVAGRPTFQNAFGVINDVFVDGSTVKYGILEPGFKDYVATMNDWYKKGLLDAEYDTNNSSVVDAKITTGEAGATVGYLGGTIGRYKAAMETEHPEFEMVMAPYPVKNKGDEVKFMEYGRTVGKSFLAISSSCKNPEAAIKWADYLYSEEGKILRNFGVTGVTYNRDGDKYVYTDEILNNPDGLSISEAMAKHFRAGIGGFGLSQHPQYLEQYYPYESQKAGIKLYANQLTEKVEQTLMPMISLTVDEANEITSLKAELDTYIKENVTKFIRGLKSMDEYDSFVEQVKKMGAKRYTEIYQAAYDRYQKR